jgi:hypothetical protein
MATTKKVPKDPEALREQLMNDPDTRAIAKNLGVELEAYVAQVVHYVTNPEEEPSFYVASDEDMRSIGWEPPDPDAIGKYLIETVAVQKAAGATEFTDPKKKLVSMDDLPPVKAPEKTDEKLQAELQKQLRGKRGGKG